MTREEAIVDLYDIKTDAVYQITSEEKDAIDMAIEALKQDWIPVTEQLPKEQEDVLVVNSRGCISVGHMFENWKRTLSWRVDCDDPEEDYYFNPIAWHPVPEYKENKE
jgi:hypothetical protein